MNQPPNKQAFTWLGLALITCCALPLLLSLLLGGGLGAWWGSSYPQPSSDPPASQR